MQYNNYSHSISSLLILKYLEMFKVHGTRYTGYMLMLMLYHFLKGLEILGFGSPWRILEPDTHQYQAMAINKYKAKVLLGKSARESSGSSFEKGEGWYYSEKAWRREKDFRVQRLLMQDSCFLASMLPKAWMLFIHTGLCPKAFLTEAFCPECSVPMIDLLRSKKKKTQTAEGLQALKRASILYPNLDSPWSALGHVPSLFSSETCSLWNSLLSASGFVTNNHLLVQKRWLL